jgi:DNA-binding MurR/RpiR family transcriptional regulator
MDLFERIYARRENLTRGEARLAEALLAEPSRIAFESAAALGARHQLSAATVVRFFAKLDYSSLMEAQNEVRANLPRYMNSPLERFSRGRAPVLIDAAIASAFTTDIDNLERLRASGQSKTIVAIARKLCAVKGAIVLYGCRNSAGPVRLLYAQLSVCLPRVELMDGSPNAIADRCIDISARDAMVVLSIRRYARSTAIAAKRFREVGAQVFAVVDGPQSPVWPFASETLHTVIDGSSLFDSYTATVSLFNALGAAVAHVRGAAVRERLERAEAQWHAFSVIESVDEAGNPGF